MANHIGKEPCFVRPRKGKRGHVRLAVDVEPALRAGLVRLARQRQEPLVHVCRCALESYLREEEWLD